MVNVVLLDVNVLIALLWPGHEFHSRAQRWFLQDAQHGWASCAITQAGFVRIASNPAFATRAISPQDALGVLRGSLRHPGHRFWAEDVSVADALELFGRRLISHQQITDAYLVALAIHKKGRLATFDTSLPSLLPDARTAKAHLIQL